MIGGELTRTDYGSNIRCAQAHATKPGGWTASQEIRFHCHLWAVRLDRPSKHAGKHSGAHITGENFDALAGLFQSYRNAVQARSDQGAKPRVSLGDPWRGAHRINPDQYNRKLARAFLEDVLNVPKTATLVGFKEVRYFDHDDLEEYLDYIRFTFDPALLVFNRRRADDVARSGWWKDHPADIAEEVRRFDQRTAAYSALHPDSCITVSYDDYVRDPQVLEPLFERLQTTFDLPALKEILSVRLKH